MKYILDTHIFLWYISGNSNLSSKHKKLIVNIDNNLYISFVSLWEIIIKLNLNKLLLNLSTNEIYEIIQNLRINILNPNQNDLEVLLKLGNYHKDPFDRLIIAQSISNDFCILTEDSIFKQYNVKII